MILKSFGGIRGFLKWAYHEHPYHVGAHVFSTVGIILLIAGNYNYLILKDGRIRYRDDFIVVRDGDPILNYVPLEDRYIPLDQRK